jgi:O-antigen/teichoic acid export membrane protein
MNIFNNFFTGVLTGVISFSIKTGLNILLVPILIHYLGLSDYGFYLLLLNFSELLVLMDIGLTTGLTQRLSHYHSLNEPQNVKKQLNVAVWLYLSISVLIALLGLGLHSRIPALFHLAPEHQSIASMAFLIVCFDASMNLIATYFQAILKAHCLHKQTNVVDASQAILNNLSTLVMVFLKFGLIEILMARLAITSLSLIVQGYLAVKSEPFLLQVGQSGTFSEFKKLLEISAFAMLQKVSVIIAHRLDEVIIGIFLTMTEVAYYGLVIKIFGQITGFSIKLMEGVFPVFTRLSNTQDKSVSRLFFLRISSFTSFVVGSLTLVVFSHYPEIIHFMSSSKIPFLPTLPLAIIIGVFCWNGALQYPAGSYLFSTGSHRVQSVIYMVTALANLCLSLLLVKPHGMIGIALGTLIPHLIQINCFTIRLACQNLELPYIDYLKNVHLLNLLPTLLLVLGLAVSRYLLGWETPSLVPFIGVTGVVLGISAIFWFKLTASQVEKDTLHRTLSGLMARFKKPSLTLKIEES